MKNAKPELYEDDPAQELGTVTMDTIDAVSREFRRHPDSFRSAWEGYAMTKKAIEDVTKLCSDMDKLLKELWDSVKAENDDAIIAYAAEIESRARNAAASYIGVSALAQRFS